MRKTKLFALMPTLILFSTTTLAQEDPESAFDLFAVDYDDMNATMPINSKFNETAFNMALESSSSHSSVSKFLERLTVDQLSSMSNATLMRYASDPSVLNQLHLLNEAVLAKLLDRLPDSVLVRAASSPDFLGSLKLEQLLLLADHAHVLDQVDVEPLIRFADQRPEVLVQLPPKVLEIIGYREDVLNGLRANTTQYLINSPVLAEKLQDFDTDFWHHFVSKHTNIIEALPKGDFATRPVLEMLLANRTFVRLTDVDVIAQLALSNVGRALREDQIRRLLVAHPHLPLRLSNEALRIQSQFFRNPSFVQSIPCATYLNMASEPSVLDQLDSQMLSVIVRSNHVWECLSEQLIRKVMQESRIGAKLDFEDVKFAAKAMIEVKRLDKNVVIDLLRFQMPLIVDNVKEQKKGIAKIDKYLDQMQSKRTWPSRFIGFFWN